MTTIPTKSIGGAHSTLAGAVLSMDALAPTGLFVEWAPDAFIHLELR